MKPLSLSKPHLIIMVGIPGSGKTFFAEHFSSTFKAPFINANHLRDQIFKSNNLNPRELRIIQQSSEYMLDEMLKTKLTILYEGKTNLRADRINLAKKARDAGYEPLFVWVQTEPITAKKRTLKSTNNQLRPEEFDNKLNRFSPPHSTEKATVISGKHTYPSQLKIVLIKLASRPTPKAKPATVTASPKRPINRNIIIR